MKDMISICTSTNSYTSDLCFNLCIVWHEINSFKSNQITHWIYWVPLMHIIQQNVPNPCHTDPYNISRNITRVTQPIFLTVIGHYLWNKSKMLWKWGPVSNIKLETAVGFHSAFSLVKCDSLTSCQFQNMWAQKWSSTNIKLPMAEASGSLKCNVAEYNMQVQHGFHVSVYTI